MSSFCKAAPAAPRQQQQFQQQLGGVARSTGQRCNRRRATVAAAALQFRPAEQKDVSFITDRLWLESMNPLGIAPERFTVAEADDGSREVLGFAQLAPLPLQTDACEFRSLVVLPEHRGKGIGSALLQRVVSGADPQATLYLTTLARTAPFYERAGFRLLQPSAVPWFLWFEVAAGTVVARIAANDQLVVMRRPPQQ